MKIRALALLLLAGLTACAGQPANLTILYTTDSHGYIVSDESGIGLDIIAATRENMPGSLLFDAGDYIQGQPAAGLSQGKEVMRLMRAAGYLAVAVGNHEFDYGLPVLLARQREAAAGPRPMHMLCANIVDTQGNYVFQPYLLIDTGGFKIGVFALTTPETVYQAPADKLRGIVFLPASQSARTMVAQLRRAGCRVVVALTHLGSDPSIPYKSTDLAEEVPGIDLIIDGHSHVPLNYLSSHGTVVVSSGAYARRLGLVEMEFDSAGRITGINSVLLNKNDLPAPNEEIKQQLAALEDNINRQLGTVLGQGSFLLDGERERARTRETNLGNLCADVMRITAAADVAIINGGGIRASIAPGNITSKDVFTVLPFGNYLVCKQVSGRELKDILESGFARLPGLSGGFPQLSGMAVKVRAANPPGQRVLEVALDNGTPLVMDKIYNLATNDFLAQGGDSYPHLADKPVYKSFGPVHQEVMDYIQLHGVADYAPGPARRIMFVAD